MREILGSELGSDGLGLAAVQGVDAVAGVPVRPASWGGLVGLSLLLAVRVALRLGVPFVEGAPSEVG
jgi:hypothetical protein